MENFDFLHGAWTVAHRRLVGRLVGATEWQSFYGTCTCLPMLGGAGNVDDNLVNLPGGAYRAVTLRTFDPAQGLWSIWWLDGRTPHRMDVPMVGTFVDGQGIFLADDVLEGRPIQVRFLWRRNEKGLPEWEQAFSDDAGAHWEVNWVMEFHPAAA